MGDLTAILWKEKRNIRILTNIHDASAEGNFCDNNGKAIKLQIVADYNRHMGYVDKGDRVTNSYSINHHRTRQKTLAYSIHHAKMSCMFGQGCHQECFSEVPKVSFSTMWGEKMLSRLPHQDKSLKHFRLFN